MKAFAAAATIGAASAIDVMTLKYMNHLAKFGKIIKDIEEFEQRFGHFAKFDKFVEEHNAEGHNYTVGHNQFSDWSHDEYKRLLGYKGGARPEGHTVTIYDESANDMQVNWIDRGAVTPVKNQAACGSCWSFSATGALEGAHQIATGNLVSFSEQQLVSCSTANYGCNGGWQYKAFQYWETYKAETEETYPYVSGNGYVPACQYDASSATSVGVSKYGFVT